MKKYLIDKEIVNIIKEKTQFLQELSFKFGVEERVSRLNKEDVYEEIVLKSDCARVEISYHYFINCKLVSLVISRLDVLNIIIFEEYLKFRKLDDGLRQIKGSLSESDQDYIDRFFKIFKESFDNELKEVLIGNTTIVVPPDYGDYK